MPKIVSRATVSSSEQATATASSKAVLRSYYCLCGDFVLVLQGKLDRLPRRRTDGAYIIRAKAGEDPSKQPARKFKLNAQPGQKCLIKRRETSDLELRQPLCCSRCKTPVAYQSLPSAVGEAPFLYVIKGAVTELQGRVPADAFEGEESLPLEPTPDSKQ
ncbi:hypothetical protein IAR50_004686 [Cryptococcus sp. DSM 104548]